MSKRRFNYTLVVHRLVRAIASQVEDFSHLDATRILVACAQCRNDAQHGTFAKLTPLRFQNGATETVEHGVRWRWPPVRFKDQDMLYIVTFYMPRFQDLPTFRERLHTLVHELYHVSPRFDGDIRRFPGRNYAHGRSRKWYDEQCAHFVDQIVERVDPACYEFLTLAFDELERARGQVVGLQPRGIAPVRVE